jgi:hypothetical protein
MPAKIILHNMEAALDIDPMDLQFRPRFQCKVAVHLHSLLRDQDMEMLGHFWMK